MNNQQISDALFELAELSKAAGENRFKSSAYRKAAVAVKEFEGRVEDLEDPTVLSGIGSGIAKKIKQLVKTGAIAKATELKEETGASELLEVPGIGPKTAKKLKEDLGVTTIDQLKKAVEEGKVNEHIATGLKAYEATDRERKRLDEAIAVANPIVFILSKKFPNAQFEACGSLRRLKETIGDIDVLCACNGERDDVLREFSNLMETILVSGDTKISGVKNGLQVDLRVVQREQFGAAILYFTGSQEFNVYMRNIAISKGMKLNEYGLYKDETRIAGETEEDIFEALGLSFVPPILRETTYYLDHSEEMENIVTEEDILGDFHVHTTWSDGDLRIIDLAEIADLKGYKFLGIADHSEKMSFANGVTNKESEEIVQEIRDLNTHHDVRILASREVEILKDGELDLPSNVDELDYIVASLHYRQKDNTGAILKAVQHPKVKVLAHPTARLVNQREPMEADWDEVFKACAEHGVALEINGNTYRLDLNPDMARRAKHFGCKFALSTDTHAMGGMGDIRFALAIAQKAGLTPEDFWNPED